ncbi:MAG: hypothetical protein ACM3N6_09785 [Betaproteobacteria bacterium]
MNLSSLRLLTWATIAGSVGSALLLAASDAGQPSPTARQAGRSHEAMVLHLPGAAARDESRATAQPAPPASH